MGGCMTIREQLPVFPRYRVRGEKTVYETLRDAAEGIGRVTLDQEHKSVRRPGIERDAGYEEKAKGLLNGAFSRSTLFKEIEAIPENEDMKAWYELSPGDDARIDAGYLAEMAVSAVMEAVEQAWDSTKAHVVPHSSGYDSRILAAAIRALTAKNGMDWLGETHFVCWQPEIAYWRRIMDYMDWPKSMQCPVYPERPALDYYREVCRFDELKDLCDVHRIWTGAALAAKALREKGVDVENAQLFSAVFSDETQKWNRVGTPKTLGSFLTRYFFDIPSIWSVYNSDIVLPFLSKPWLSLMMRYRIPCPVDQFKLEMIRILDPNLADVNRFPNYRFVLGPILSTKGYGPYQRLSMDTVREMTSDLNRSWYGKMIAPKCELPGPVLHPYSENGSDYVKAAICEGLVERGVRIVNE